MNRYTQKQIYNTYEHLFPEQEETQPIKDSSGRPIYSVAPSAVDYVFVNLEDKEGFLQLLCIARHKETGTVAVAEATVADDPTAIEEQRIELKKDANCIILRELRVHVNYNHDKCRYIEAPARIDDISQRKPDSSYFMVDKALPRPQM